MAIESHYPRWMQQEYQGQPIYIKDYVAPLTINKLFAGFGSQAEGKAYAEYTAFVDHVLKEVGDIGPDDPIFGFDVRSGIHTPVSQSGTSDTFEATETGGYSRESDFERLAFERDSFLDMNKKLSEARAKDRSDNQTFFWAMVGLAGIIVLGLLGFGD